MSKRKFKKQERHQALNDLLDADPFLTDEELCEKFNVSIQTIRLDRLELNIPELRTRVKSVATKQYDKLQSISKAEIVGDLIDLQPNVSGISFLEADAGMVFKKTKIVKGHYIFAMAESLALAVIDAKVALTGVANVKYQEPVYAGDKLVAKAVVKSMQGNEYYVHLRIMVKDQEVFRSKFKMTAMEG
ncbi:MULTISPECIES: transcription factor FapR [unclassified Fusibacter]|uniref:transcription factor FapR n=1 Tax=unclassified Fusibacter TaxID=2624464 RepID=UPI001011C2EE|nr:MULTISPECIES: transcription factor FapR [unclassified Fusibacter]MCK8058073.1 transcription factor FapR [Fusibacter sp. A2]NPE20655.1 transcription factor FapR [Fusibacter sp. A1]RXV62861.1 transcription factor FapR [Fusibacter sp. A1]